MTVCVFNYLLKDKYSNLSIAAAFSSKSYSTSKTSLSVKNSYLITPPHDKAEI